MIWPRCSLELGTFFFVSSGTLRHRSGGRGGHPAHPGCAGQALNSNRGRVTVERRERHGAIRYSPGNGNRSSAHRYTQSPSRTSVHTHARLTVILPDTHARPAHMHAQLTCTHSSHARTAHMHAHSSSDSLSPLTHSRPHSHPQVKGGGHESVPPPVWIRQFFQLAIGGVLGGWISALITSIFLRSKKAQPII